jgi:tetratricopeptide (TPR) repeat protein
MSAASRVRTRDRVSRVICGALVALGLLAGCTPKAPTRGPLDEAGARARAEALERHLKRSPDDRGAMRDLAHLRWLYLEGLAQARPILERLAGEGDLVAMGSLMMIAEARLETETARDWATRLLKGANSLAAGDAERPWALGLAAAAARLLEEQLGEGSGDDAAFIRVFEGLALERFPAAVRQPLLSARAGIARRYEEPYLSFYDAAGCVRAWQVGEVEGTLGELELRTAPQGPLKVDAGAMLTPLSCAVRVWNPTTRAGARRLATTLTAPGGAIELEIAGQQPLRAYLDGALIMRTDLDDRWPARRSRVRVPVAAGAHRLELHVALPSDRAWALVRATDGAGNPLPTEAEAVAPARPAGGSERAALVVAPIRSPFAAAGGRLADPIYRPWMSAFALGDALADGDNEAAEVAARALAGSRATFPEGQVMIAAFEAADPTRERTSSAARERRALERALAKDPGLDRARIRLLEMALDRGDVAEVLAELEGLPPGMLSHVPGEMLRYRAYLVRGSEPLAEAALARAAARSPRSCEALQEQRLLAQRRLEVEREAALTEASRRCPGTLRARASLAQRRGDFARARTLLNEALTRTPDDVEVIEALVELEIADRRFAAALALRERLLALNPFSARARIGAADLMANAGDPGAARAAVRESITRLPWSSALREIGADVGIPDELAALRVDGMAALRAYWGQEIAPYPGASEVLVLDRSAAQIYPGGGARQIVHTITELRSREAVDRYGEVQIPEGARLLTLHSVKRDGRVIDPELIPGKDGLSLRELAIGDAVELELVIDEEPNGLLPGVIDLSTFRFQSFDVPFHVSELVVMYPESMKVLAERRGGAPSGARRAVDGSIIETWRVEGSLRRGVEPNLRSPLDELPSVRVYTPFSAPQWLETLALRLVKAQRGNPELRALAARLTRGQKSEEARLRALWGWVVEKIEDAGDVSVPATRTLSARKGNRLMLLRALLQAVGIRSELWIARDRFGPELLAGGHPLLETYEAPVLMVWLKGQTGPMPVLTNSKVAPIGYLPPNLAGSPALRVRLRDDEPAPGAVTMPGTPAALRDRREYTIAVTLSGEGRGRASGTITLGGMEAIAWREALRNLDRDRLEEGFERAELAVLAPGATFDLESLEIEGEASLAAPLVLRFTAKVRGLGVRQGGELILRSSLVPMNLGLGFAGLPKRSSGLVIPYAPAQSAEVTIQLEKGRFRAAPGAASVRASFGGYTRRVETSASGDSVVIRTESSLRPGVIEAEEYGDLVEMTQAIRRAEDEVARVVFF